MDLRTKLSATRRVSSVLVLALVAVACLSGCAEHQPTLAFSLPDTCNTPDGMTLCDKTNVMYLSCPNFCENISYPAVIMKITPDNQIEKFCDLPMHADTNRCGPMGVDLGPDGHLYVADNQYFYNTHRKSRLLRVKIKDGKADGVEVAADGFSLANAIIWRGNTCYVSDTFSEEEGKSYIYKLTLEEMAKGTVHLAPGDASPHVFAIQKTIKRGRGDTAGADGLTFDGDGNLYCGNFGDGRIFKYAIDQDGKGTQTLLIDDPKLLPSADGMFWRKADNTIYLAESASNAVRAFTPEGKVWTIWENGDTTGADGLLDQPCEVIVRGNEMFVVCFDMTFPGLKNSAYDKVHTISVIQLK